MVNGSHTRGIVDKASGVPWWPKEPICELQKVTFYWNFRSPEGIIGSCAFRSPIHESCFGLNSVFTVKDRALGYKTELTAADLFLPV
ncbi:unnamed protein product [Brassica rapa]|uniref:Uncharacterized protein n=2 Tax=Brassica TaxID=3705 RepID=A0A8D9DNQ1_BRACM|nr:unnamed protein product [Brassica napus]CAG7878959.1 unnamed protein product [Brassica rapa]